MTNKYVHKKTGKIVEAVLIVPGMDKSGWVSEVIPDLTKRPEEQGKYLVKICELIAGTMKKEHFEEECDLINELKEEPKKDANKTIYIDKQNGKQVYVNDRMFGTVFHTDVKTLEQCWSHEEHFDSAFVKIESQDGENFKYLFDKLEKAKTDIDSLKTGNEWLNAKLKDVDTQEELLRQRYKIEAFTGHNWWCEVIKTHLGYCNCTLGIIRRRDIEIDKLKAENIELKSQPQQSPTNKCHDKPDKIDPCPWCKSSENVSVGEYSGLDTKKYKVVFCDNENCQAHGPIGSSNNEAIRKWNKLGGINNEQIDMEKLQKQVNPAPTKEEVEAAKVSSPAPEDAYVKVVCSCQSFGILRGHGEVCSICQGTGFQGVLFCQKNGNCSWTPQNMKAFKDEPDSDFVKAIAKLNQGDVIYINNEKYIVKVKTSNLSIAVKKLRGDEAFTRLLLLEDSNVRTVQEFSNTFLIYTNNPL